jgi:hypothetical protein
MKKITQMLILMIIFCLGCAGPAVQIGASLAGDFAAHTLKSVNFSSKPNIALGKEIEKYYFGNHVVVMRNGLYKSAPATIFTAYKNGQEIRSVCYEEKNSEDRIDMNNYNN